VTFDPFTFLAQLLNFALLLVLLRVFLYRPVLAVMRRREELAAAALDEARRLQAEAEEERRALAAERDAEERERAARLAALEDELERLRHERLAAVDREAREARTSRAEALAREVERAVARLGPELARLVVDEVSETIAWLTGADADGLAVDRFVERLRGLPPERREELRSAAREGPVRLVTARALGGSEVDEARRAVADALGVERVELATDPGLLAGAALEAGGLRLDGSAAARLAALEERFARALAEPRGEPGEGAA
jgi:F-type H+-transporting ATPase subunit b